VSHHYVSLRVDIDGDGVSDAWEDSDGDGAFNIQELMIGKNPANPHDIVGYEIVVAVMFDASDEYLSRLAQALCLATCYIFDYTDGYAIISSIKIYDNVKEGSPEYNEANVRIKDLPEGVLGQAVYRAFIEVDKDVLTESMEKFVYVFGHEFGHYAFDFGEEYKDENGKYYWDCRNLPRKLVDEGIITVMGFGLWEIPTEKLLECELSTYDDYQRLKEIIEEYGYECSWRSHQWSKWVSRGLNYGFCWYSLIYELTHRTRPVYPALVVSDMGVVVFSDVHDCLIFYEHLEGPFTMVSLYLWWP